MAETSRPHPRSRWPVYALGFGLLGLTFLIAVVLKTHPQKSPLPVIGPVADFTLTNQDGNLTTLANFTNHVWVADIIFTRCAGPCPRLTSQMKTLQTELAQDSNTRLVTLTTDPEFDTPEVLKRYGQHYGADFGRWTFLTGPKLEIGRLGANSLKLSAQPVKLEEQKDAVDLFIHTTIFVVVDKHAQLRAFFETGGEGVDWTNSVLPKLLATVGQLENEP